MNLHATKGVYAITDCDNYSGKELLHKSEIILKTGVSLFQFRKKHGNEKDKKELAITLQQLCQNYNTPLIINDDPKLTKEINADGVHLGKLDDDITSAREIVGNKIIGISCYDKIDRAIEAENKGADYVAFGSFFPSSTKPDAAQAPLDLLIKAKILLSIPIVAIGGITPENGKLLVDAKVNFIAVISGLYNSTDTAASTTKYNNLFTN